MIIAFQYKCVCDSGFETYRIYKYGTDLAFNGCQFRFLDWVFTPICAWKIKDKK